MTNQMPHSNGISAIVEPPKSNVGPMGDLVVYLSSVADDIPAWGTSPLARDMALRNFWPTEPFTASALTTMASKYASFGWTLEGPQRTVAKVQDIFNWVENGAGWNAFIIKVLIDMFSQDNGAWIEVVRSGPNASDPVVSLNHLDSARCIRTGRKLEPVIYVDDIGGRHLLKWWQAFDLTEMPSPIERARGLQYCAITRILRGAQIMKDIGIYEKEKIGGRFNKSIILVGGVQAKTIEDVLARQTENANAVGLLRYLQPAIVASLDPTAQVSKQVIELASLPDHFDKEVEMRWFIEMLALGFLTDYQEFAPLPAGNLGTSQQSQVLEGKSRGKGPSLFMSTMEHKFNFYGIMPRNVTFKYGNQDMTEDENKGKMRLVRAQERAARIQSLEITPEIARQLAVDAGDLKMEYLVAMGEQNLTPDISAGDAIPVKPITVGEPQPEDN